MRVIFARIHNREVINRRSTREFLSTNKDVTLEICADHSSLGFDPRVGDFIRSILASALIVCRPGLSAQTTIHLLYVAFINSYMRVIFASVPHLEVTSLRSGKFLPTFKVVTREFSKNFRHHGFDPRVGDAHRIRLTAVVRVGRSPSLALCAALALGTVRSDICLGISIAFINYSEISSCKYRNILRIAAKIKTFRSLIHADSRNGHHCDFKRIAVDNTASSACNFHHISTSLSSSVRCGRFFIKNLPFAAIFHLSLPLVRLIIGKRGDRSSQRHGTIC